MEVFQVLLTFHVCFTVMLNEMMLASEIWFLLFFSVQLSVDFCSIANLQQQAQIEAKLTMLYKTNRYV